MILFQRQSALVSAILTVVLSIASNAQYHKIYDRTDTSDSILSREDAFIENIEEKVRSTLMNGVSSPIGFSGEARLKLQYHSFSTYPSFMRNDRSWIQAGWEGNEGLLRLGMVICAGHNVTIYSKIGFQHTLPGNYLNRNKMTADGFTPIGQRHDRADEPAYIHEDLLAGVALRTRPATFMLKLGGLQWIETSPLTVWKHQQRMFAWDYLPYEIEESIVDYYDKNMIEGERTGRAAWNKKPFNGIGLESVDLPWNLHVDFFYGSFEAFDKMEREYVDLQGDLAYYSEYDTEAKGRGIGDSYRNVVFGRLAKERVFGWLTPGINVVTIGYDDDIERNTTFRKAFSIRDTEKGNAFYKEPVVGSMDFRGKIGGHFSLHIDAACSRVDTSLLLYPENGGTPATGHHLSRFRGAVYASFNDDHLIPLRLDLFCAQPGFYSPFSSAKSIDGFFPFGSNLVGPGEFAASAYTQNMTGFSCTAAPFRVEENGHCRVTYGNHRQIRAAPDVLYFPYRLNGADMFSLFQTSYSRWGLNLLDYSMNPNDPYSKRLGDESFKRSIEGRRPLGPEAGGLRSYFLGLYESFVPYPSADSAQRNIGDNTMATIFHRGYVPQHLKYTFNCDLDAAYDVASLFGWSNSIYLSVYASFNGITTKRQIIALDKNSDATLLWGALARFEGAAALRDGLYVLVLAGFENWYADKAWMQDTSGLPSHAPIDYRDFAYGIGCDWQMLERVGVHLRCKWMKHVDMKYSGNNWDTPVVSGELKMWF